MMNQTQPCGRILILKFFLFFICLFAARASFAQDQPAEGIKIRLNQTGFYPGAHKIAIVLADTANTFYVKTLDKKTVYIGKMTKSAKPGLNGKFTQIADFTAFNTPGNYQLNVSGSGYSYPFHIAKNVHANVAAGAIKAYYFMRASVPLKEKYAGKWSRAEGHPDTAVLIHPSAVSDGRPVNSIISSPRGWYDAGDYNKYIVNSGITTGTLLSLYEDFPAYMKTVKLNIPESGNGIPDVLNEALWNLRWMLTMQDPADGGVYHKLTNAAFDGMEMPDKGTAPRYVVQKGTAATLDFAAVMAQASRILANFKKQLPGLSDSCIRQANLAWAWAQKNPNVTYEQDAMNQKFEPKVTTGAYGDRNFSDEFIWAASELFVTTLRPEYLKALNLDTDTALQIPSWGQVKMLGYYSLLRNSASAPANQPEGISELKKHLIAFADGLVNGADETAYQTVMTKNPRNFNWGSNSNAANQGILLIQAYKLTGNKRYLGFALANLDYLLGRNASGYSYVTGFGSKRPMHPHHRPSVSDGIIDPIPGLLVGGPNPGMQDKIKVPSTVPDEAYIDDDRAYAANEIAINWNAPFVYLANAIEALQRRL